MLCLIAVECFLFFVMPSPGASSYLQADEAKWAKRLGVQESYVRQIVKAAGYSTDDEVRIERLDIRNLRPRRHVLLVTAAGNGHCLTITVVDLKGSLKTIWSLSELPGGAGLCHDGARSDDFRVHAAAGKIIVEVPHYEDGRYVVEGTKQLIYKWDGQTYQRTGPK